MTITHDLVELTNELSMTKTAAPELMPRVLLYLGKTCVTSCQELTRIESDMEKVAAMWEDLATSLAGLVDVVQVRYPGSNAIRELWNLQREAAEMSAFYNEVPSLK